MKKENLQELIDKANTVSFGNPIICVEKDILWHTISEEKFCSSWSNIKNVSDKVIFNNIKSFMDVLEIKQ